MSDNTITREQVRADPAAALELCRKHGTLRVVYADAADRVIAERDVKLENE